jgi:hypothetical protein
MGPLMLKRAALILGAIIYASIAHAAGTVPGFSLTPQFDLTGKVMPGCLLYVYQAGTVATPQNAYQDTGLANLQPNPMVCDASGRLPQWFVADGLIKLRLTTSIGTQVFVGDNLLVVGPSSGGGGGGGTIDPTTIAQTGDLKTTYGTGPITGWVRMNGRTIGSATSGATERANADVQALFTFLWNSDPTLAVSGGRGASAAADWSANKTIALPDARNRALAGLGDMGNSDLALFNGTTFSSGNSTTLGSTIGVGTPRILQRSDLPNIVLTYSGTFNLNQSGIVQYSGGAFAGGVTVGGSGGGTAFNSGPPGLITPSVNITGNTSGLNGGVGQTSFNTVSPLLLVTTYIKL